MKAKIIDVIAEILYSNTRKSIRKWPNQMRYCEAAKKLRFDTVALFSVGRLQNKALCH